MNTALRKIFWYCILFNLLLGNLFILTANLSSVHKDVNFLLMACMSAACVFWYYALFKVVTFNKHGIITLGIISIIASMAILLSGGWLYNFISSLLAYDEFSLQNVSVSFFLSIPVTVYMCIRLSFIAIVMGMVNMLWLVKAKAKQVE